MRDHGDEDDARKLAEEIQAAADAINEDQAEIARLRKARGICGICCDELAEPCPHSKEIARLRKDWEEASDAWAGALTDNASLRKERDRLRKGWARAVVKQWQAGAWKGHRRVVLASRLSEVYDREVSVEEAREVERESH